MKTLYEIINDVRDIGENQFEKKVKHINFYGHTDGNPQSRKHLEVEAYFRSSELECISVSLRDRTDSTFTKEELDKLLSIVTRPSAIKVNNRFGNRSSVSFRYHIKTELSGSVNRVFYTETPNEYREIREILGITQDNNEERIPFGKIKRLGISDIPQVYFLGLNQGQKNSFEVEEDVFNIPNISLEVSGTEEWGWFYNKFNITKYFHKTKESEKRRDVERIEETILGYRNTRLADLSFNTADIEVVRFPNIFSALALKKGESILDLFAKLKRVDQIEYTFDEKISIPNYSTIS